MRTSETAIRGILETSLNTPQIQMFMQDASLWVTEELAEEGYSDERMELIERYLACALVRLRDLGLKVSEMKEVREQYQVDPTVTDYLLRAASFDSSGKLRRAFLTASGDSSSATFPVRMRVGTLFTECSE